MAFMKALDALQDAWKNKYAGIGFTDLDVPDDLIETVNVAYPDAITWLMDTARQCMRTEQYGKAKVIILWCPI